MKDIGKRFGWMLAIGLLAISMLLFAAACDDDDDDNGNGNGDQTPVATEDGNGNGNGGDDEQAIQDVIDAAAAAWNAGDVDAFLAFFTDAGVMATFDAPREAAVEFLPDFIGDPPISVGELTNISVDGDTATADAAEFAFGRIYDPNTFSFARADGSWLIDGEEDLLVEIPEGTTAVDISLFEYGFQFDAAEITSGNFAFNSSNIGGEDHEIAIVVLEGETTVEEAVEAEDFPAGVEIVGVAGPWSPGTDAVVRFTDDLAAGRYGLLCFVENAEGVPHAFLGMVDEFTIE